MDAQIDKYTRKLVRDRIAVAESIRFYRLDDVVIANREDWTPPPQTIIDPEAPNPYVRTDREFLYFHLPGAEYIQGVSGREVRYRINRR